MDPFQVNGMNGINSILEASFLRNHEGYGLHFGYFGNLMVQINHYETLSAVPGKKIPPMAMENGL